MIIRFSVTCYSELSFDLILARPCSWLVPRGLQCTKKNKQIQTLQEHTTTALKTPTLSFNSKNDFKITTVTKNNSWQSRIENFHPEQTLFHRYVDVPILSSRALIPNHYPNKNLSLCHQNKTNSWKNIHEEEHLEEVWAQIWRNYTQDDWLGWQIQLRFKSLLACFLSFP